MNLQRRVRGIDEHEFAHIGGQIWVAIPHFHFDFLGLFQSVCVVVCEFRFINEQQTERATERQKREKHTVEAYGRAV